MNCRNPECKCEVNPKAIYCGRCGVSIVARCTVCGAPIPMKKNVKFCSECSTMLSEMRRPEPEPGDGTGTGTGGSTGTSTGGSTGTSTGGSTGTGTGGSTGTSTGGSTGTGTGGTTGTSKWRITSINWATFVHPAICLAYMLYNIITIVSATKSLSNSDDPFGLLGAAAGLVVVNGMLRPLLITMGIGTIFSIAGLIVRKPWPYLTAAIIQSVGLLVGLPVELMDIAYLVASIVMVLLGFIAYYQKNKEQATQNPVGTELR